ncbi:sigma-70 family RNA polymerase sigma factor [Microlunatus panaciterrae]|uniref:RNA polymerase sigma factor (Sigma-70 family) n=1 Tax=Microlunatus panaciterrae TaxID=400768 RepID=A0ABS2RN46_9ACTN|nr:RNA polymerase sigma factor [Microlunatus panaciterrae]MBM7800402.1 RNA polymerase sigma factor (sigma-70 family) [Microlunatus panaciterrae]
MRPFEQIVTDYGATVFRVCRAMLGPVEAEDAWSETFLAAMRAYPELPATSNIEAWLVTIAHRKAIDQHRLRKRAPVPVERLAELYEPADDPPEVGLPDDLWQALRRLPDKQRAAVAYHHLAGLPYAEVARILGNSETAARRAAADGIHNLRRNFRQGAQT